MTLQIALDRCGPGNPRALVKVESTTIDGVKVNFVTPDDRPAENRDKVIVHERESPARYQLDDRVPETKEAFGEIAAFFGKHLGK